MKSLSKMLERSDLTAKDRILLRIHNDINEMKTGKSILSESDVYNIAEGWKPKDNFEVQEYNKYLNTWKSLRFVAQDIQTIYLNAIIDIGAVEKVLLYFVLKSPKEYSRFLTDDLKEKNQDKTLSLLLKNTGFKYESALHKMTFDSLPKNIQKDLLALDPESEYESSYFKDEEDISKILKNKTELDTKEIEELTDIIMDSVRWEHEHELFLNERFFVRNLVHGYFADIPMKIFVERMAKNLKIKLENDKELIKKISKIDAIKTHLRKAVRDEVSKGIFFSDYVPLCNSTDHMTCNRISTKLPHNELLDIWVEEKDRNRRLIQEHIDSGKLVLENKGKKIFTAEIYDEIITGESMYHSNLDLHFVKEYKSQIEQIMVFGDLVYLVNERRFPEYYQNILAFQELLKKISEILETDVGFMCEKYLEDLGEEIDLLKRHIHTIGDKITDLLHVENDNRYYMEIYIDNMIMNRTKLKPKKYEGQKLYEAGVTKEFGERWKDL